MREHSYQPQNPVSSQLGAWLEQASTQYGPGILLRLAHNYWDRQMVRQQLQQRYGIPSADADTAIAEAARTAWNNHIAAAVADLAAAA